MFKCLVAKVVYIDLHNCISIRLDESPYQKSTSFLQQWKKLFYGNTFTH